MSVIVDELGIDSGRMRTAPLLELLRVAEYKQALCCRAIALGTCKNKSEIENEKLVAKRAEVIGGLCTSDIASLLTKVLEQGDISDILREYHLDKDLEDYRRVREAKDTKNTYIFCGKTLMGNFIDYFCNRYGWTIDHVLWEESLDRLRLLQADVVKDIYLTDDEARHCAVSADRTFINMDDPGNADILQHV